MCVWMVGEGLDGHFLLLEFPRHVAEPEWNKNSSSVNMEPDPVYYPGTEINGYMPRRGDFAHVSGCNCLLLPQASD